MLDFGHSESCVGRRSRGAEGIELNGIEDKRVFESNEWVLVHVLRERNSDLW